MSRRKQAAAFAKTLVSRFRDDDVPSLAAQLTYYLILSFFPFLIFLVSVIGFLSFSGDGVIQEFIRVLPTDTGKSVSSIVSEVTANRSRAVLSVGMAATIWAASNGVNAIIKGLNKAYDEEETRPYWKVRAISILATIVLAIVILVAMLLLVFGQVIGEYLFRLLSLPVGFPVVWKVFQVAVPIIAMFGVFLLLFRMTPDRRLTWKEVIPGSVFTTVGWIASSLLFSFYVNHFGHFSNTYGSLGGIIVLLIWLYWSSIIVMLGGEINATVAVGREGRQKSAVQKHGRVIPMFRNRSRLNRT